MFSISSDYFKMDPANQPPRSTASATPAPKIAKKKKVVRSFEKLHVVFDSSVGEPRGCNCHKFFRAIGAVVSRHAPRNVRKWDHIPEKKIQSMIDHVLCMFDVDISKPYVKNWILWRMKLRFRCIMEGRAKQKAQNAEVMELMSKLAIGSFENKAQSAEIMELMSKLAIGSIDNKAQYAEVMELMSKLAIGPFDKDLLVDSTCT